MCGRYASARSVDDLASTFGVSGDDIDELPAADWNVAPTKDVPAVLMRAGRRVLTSLRWGLVPTWSTGPEGSTLFNARVETVLEKPAFRDAIRRRRCLLPADGWYEWARVPDGRRVPHFLTRRDREVVAMAGLWEVWRDAEGRTLASTTVLTGAAEAGLAAVHDRAPVVLERDGWAAWLDPDAPPTVVMALMRPTDADLIDSWPVADAVGDVRAAGPHLATPVQLDEQPPLF